MVPVESYRLYESTQYKENDVAGENWETENTLRGVINDFTCPKKSLVAPIEGLHSTTVVYWKSIVNYKV